jgi:hypothetical protein
VAVATLPARVGYVVLLPRAYVDDSITHELDGKLYTAAAQRGVAL